ncbi:lysylphosphatidylglycerol synthase transmembrane domain-containing protein [Roseivivax sp. CAU 1761]
MFPALRLSRKQMRLLQIVVSLTLLAVLWRAVDGAEAARILARAEPLWLAAAWAMLSAQTVLSALRWKVTAGRLGQKFTARGAISEYYLAQIVNQSLPGGMVGDASRAVRARHHAGLLRASQAVVFERLAGQAMVFAVMTASFLWTWSTPGGLYWPVWAQSIVMPLIVGGLCVPVVFWFTSLLPGPQKRALDDLWYAITVSLISRKVLWKQVLLSIATTICNLAAFAFCARATGTELSLAAVTGIVPLILFTMLIPVSISGWGLREGAAATLLPIAGATSSAGLAASVAFGLIFILAVLPGVIPILRRQSAVTPEAEAPPGAILSAARAARFRGRHR